MLKEIIINKLELWLWVIDISYNNGLGFFFIKRIFGVCNRLNFKFWYIYFFVLIIRVDLKGVLKDMLC